MNLRPLAKADVPAVSAIVSENYAGRYAKESAIEFGAMFGAGPWKPQYVVAEKRGEIVGVAGYAESCFDWNVYGIFWVNVRRKYQGRGVGKLLVRHVLAVIKELGGSVVLLTTGTPRYYAEQFRFRTVLRFRNGKHAVMALELKPTKRVPANSRRLPT